MIRVEGYIPRRLRRNKGYVPPTTIPYENNIPRCQRGMLIVLKKKPFKFW